MPTWYSSDVDQHQFAYRGNGLTDAICVALNTPISHLERHNTRVRMLFVVYSSMFN